MPRIVNTAGLRATKPGDANDDITETREEARIHTRKPAQQHSQHMHRENELSKGSEYIKRVRGA